MKPHVVISEFMDDDAVASLRGAFDVTYDAALVDDMPRLRATVARADALIVRNRTRVDAALLAVAPRLRAVGRLGVGLDNIDLDGCRARGIAVLPATGANGDAVAEYVIATAMILLRGLHTATAEVASGAWPRARLSEGRELGGKTLGLVGFGDIARRVARLARAFAMPILAFDPNLDPHDAAWWEYGADPASLDEVLARADVVSLHVPLAVDTRHLVDAARLARMKRDAILVDTARGGVVDEAALATALREGRLGGAAMDVFAQEPPGAGSPLADCPNVLLTPHVAGLTLEANRRVSWLVAEKVAGMLSRTSVSDHAPS